MKNVEVGRGTICRSHIWSSGKGMECGAVQ